MNPMLELFSNWLAQFNAYTQHNPVLAGVVSLYGLGILTFLLRNVPLRLWNTVMTQCTTRLVVDNTFDGRSDELFQNLMAWFSHSRWGRYARVIRVYGGWYNKQTVSMSFDGSSLDSHADASFNIGIDESPQFCIWEGMPCVMSRVALSNSSTHGNRMLYEVRLTRLGRNRESLMRLLQKVTPDAVTKERFTFHYGGDGWRRGGVLSPREMSSVIIEASIKQQIVSHIEWFLANEAWYVTRGIPYKLCILLTGEPGNGKSSLIRALATRFQNNIYSIALPHMSDEGLSKAILEVPRGDFVVLEDFNHTSLLARNDALAVGTTQPTTQSNVVVAKSSFEFLTLRGFLNVIDGVESIHGKVLILTTNVIEELDRAVVRKGRIDHTFYLNQLTTTEIREYIAHVFPNCNPIRYMNNIFAPISGADLQALYIASPDDVESFIHSIPIESLKAHG